LPTLQASVERREMRREMDEETRQDRTLAALENIAAELERLRLLREYELAVIVEEEGADPRVVPVEPR
jgi:hypothetical protein